MTHELYHVIYAPAASFQGVSIPDNIETVEEDGLFIDGIYLEATDHVVYHCYRDPSMLIELWNKHPSRVLIVSSWAMITVIRALIKKELLGFEVRFNAWTYEDGLIPVTTSNPYTPLYHQAPATIEFLAFALDEPLSVLIEW